MIVTILKHIYDTDVEKVNITKISDLPRTINDKEYASAWNPYDLTLSPYKEDNQREFIDTTIKVKLLVYDYDFEEEITIDKYIYFSHNTHNRKWRIIIPLKNEITIDVSDFKILYEYVAFKINLPKKEKIDGVIKKGYDTTCSNFNRFYFLPTPDVKINQFNSELLNIDPKQIIGDITTTKIEEPKKFYGEVNEATVERLRKLHEIFKTTAKFEVLHQGKECLLPFLHDSKEGHKNDLIVNLPSKDNSYSINIHCFHESCYSNNVASLKALSKIPIDVIGTLSETEAYLLSGLVNNVWDFSFIEKLYLPKFLNENYDFLLMLKNRVEQDVIVIYNLFFKENVIYHNDVQYSENGEIYEGDLNFYEYKGGVYNKTNPTHLTDKISGHLKSWYRYKYWSLNDNNQVKMTAFKEELLSHVREGGMRNTFLAEGLPLQNGFLGLDRVETNGKVKLKVTFTPHSNRIMAQHKLEYGYDPDAKCPTWERILKEYFPKDQLSIDLIQEMFGICLTSWRDYEKFFILYGETRTGKGTICETLMRLVNGMPATLKDLTIKERLGDYASRKIIFFDETFEGANVNIRNCIKSLSSTTPVACRNLYGKSYASHIFPKMIFAFNTPPKNFEADSALFSRLRVVKFVKSFAKNPDTRLKNYKLPSELPGILNWALIGLNRLVERGDIIKNASDTEELFSSIQDNFGLIIQFVKELDKDEYFLLRQLSDMFHDKYGEEINEPIKNKEFSTMLKRIMRTDHKRFGLSFQRDLDKEKDIDDSYNLSEIVHDEEII